MDYPHDAMLKTSRLVTTPFARSCGSPILHNMAQLDHHRAKKNVSLIWTVCFVSTTPTARAKSCTVLVRYSNQRACMACVYVGPAPAFGPLIVIVSHFERCVID